MFSAARAASAAAVLARTEQRLPTFAGAATTRPARGRSSGAASAPAARPPWFGLSSRARRKEAKTRNAPR
eukprot:3995169-Heterocapsa_arctica.AAC.1